MSNPFIGEIRLFCGQLCAGRMGVLRWGYAPDRRV